MCALLKAKFQRKYNANSRGGASVGIVDIRARGFPHLPQKTRQIWGTHNMAKLSARKNGKLKINKRGRGYLKVVSFQ
jgi:hypothetical protein